MGGAEERGSSAVNGTGTMPGGKYGTLAINGSGTIDGDVECEELRINGAGRIGGSVTAQSVKVNGQGTFDGPVSAQEFDLNGQTDVHGGAGVGVLRVKGSMSLDGGVAAREVDLRGEIKVGGDLEADSLTGEGRFVVKGMMSADVIDLKLHGQSAAGEIGGERITLSEPTGITSLFSMFGDRKLTCDSIEADDVWLVYTTAKVVRGSRVTLGEGCDVELVEYTDSFTRAAGARVGEERKVERTG